MTLTKADLQEWNSHPVTKAIFKLTQEQSDLLAQESTLRDTADQTAMQTARNEGQREGIEAFAEAYEIALEEAD